METVLDILHTAGARRFFEYWNSLPKKDFVPDRKDFNPAAIYSLMPSISILEVLSREHMDMRFIGTDLVERIGMDPTGGNYLDLMIPSARETFLDILYTQLSQPCGRHNIMLSRHESGLLNRVEVISLPMTHVASGNPLVISCFEKTESIGVDDGGREVRGFDHLRWIDIGAGVPAA